MVWPRIPEYDEPLTREAVAGRRCVAFSEAVHEDASIGTGSYVRDDMGRDAQARQDLGCQPGAWSQSSVAAVLTDPKTTRSARGSLPCFRREGCRREKAECS